MPSTDTWPRPRTETEEAETETTRTTRLWDPDAESTARPFTYRHTWPYTGRGVVTLILHHFFGVKRDWKVYVFASSADVADDHTATTRAVARFNVTNTVVRDGQVIVTIHVDNEVHTELVTDFLIVPTAPARR